MVISIHDPKHHIGDKVSQKTPQAIMNFAYRRADRIIAHNEPMKQMIIEELQIPEEIIDIIPLIER
ncbi:MAG: glycosyltransferase, partial [Gammaproteobacteria bacterium]|nr:glycosyltransferase [Gammaproteobacteria bacterium]